MLLKSLLRVSAPLVMLCTLALFSYSYAISGNIILNNPVSNDPTGKIFIVKDFGDISNCGPIAALMSVKYINKNFSTEKLMSKIDRAREIVQLRPDDPESEEVVALNSDMPESIDYRWWKMRDIKKYLTYNDVKYQSVVIEKNQQAIIDALDKKSIVIVNINMNDMPRGDEVGKSYLTLPIPGGWGHFLVIVGYKDIDGRLAFEAHDSFTKKGKNRYFFADDIMSAINRYYREILVIRKEITLHHLWASAEW